MYPLLKKILDPPLFTLLVQTVEVGMILHSFLKLIFELNRNEKEMIKTALSIYF